MSNLLQTIAEMYDKNMRSIEFSIVLVKEMTLDMSYARVATHPWTIRSEPLSTYLDTSLREIAFGCRILILRDKNIQLFAIRPHFRHMVPIVRNSVVRYLLSPLLQYFCYFCFLFVLTCARHWTSEP